MRFTCNRGPEEKRARVQWLHEWQVWFAWRPVPIGNRTCVWLEFVERRYPMAFLGASGTVWEYSAEYRSTSIKETK